jgi:hypothetical protein
VRHAGREQPVLAERTELLHVNLPLLELVFDVGAPAAVARDAHIRLAGHGRKRREHLNLLVQRLHRGVRIAGIPQSDHTTEQLDL